MNWDLSDADWRALAPRVRAEWPDLNRRDLREIAGRRQRLIDKITELYGWEPEEAERQVEVWSDTALEDLDE